MTRTQALAAVAYSHRSSRETAAAVTLAFPRYVVYDMRGYFFVESDRLDFAKAARLQVMGTIVDRQNWKNS